jgi:hypothetical protein
LRPQIVPFFIIGLVLVIIGGSYLIQSRLEKKSKVMNLQLKQIQKAISTGNHQAALKKLDVFDETWNKTKKGWSLITDHREMDEIEMSLARLESLLKRKNPTLALEELSVMEHLVKHIPEKERFNWLNVL